MKKNFPLLFSLKRLEQDLLQSFGQEVPLIPFSLQAGDRETAKSDIDVFAFLPDLAPRSLSLAEHIGRNAIFHAGITVSLIPVLSQEIGQIKAKKDEAASTLFALAQNSSTSARRRKCLAEALEYLERNEEAAQVWLTLGQNEHVNPLERIKAANALNRLGYVEEVETILLSVAHDEKVGASKRIKAAAALRKAGHIEAAASLLLAYAKENHFPVWEREKAARMLAAWRLNQQAAQAWLYILQDEQVDGGIRIHAAEALGSLGRIEEAFPILRALMHTREALVAREAARIAGEFGHMEEAKLVVLAIAQNKNVESWIRLSAAWLLSKWNYIEEYVQILLAIARDEASKEGQLMAADQLVDLGFVEEALPVLRMLMWDDTLGALLRKEAAVTLATKLGYLDEARFILLKLAQDELLDERARGWIMEALEELG
jgi:thioredoxin-like negative regulator of GroEL